MANLITIGGYVVPTPSTYTANTATIVNSARNADGFMTGSVIRDDVAKVSMTWNFLDVQAWAAILQLFDPKYGATPNKGKFTRSVTFFNQVSAALETRTMYVSDRNAESFLLFNEENAPSADWIGLPRGYTGASLSLIEV